MNTRNPTLALQAVFPQHPRALGTLPPSQLDSRPPAPTSPHPPVIPPSPFQAITAQDACSNGGDKEIGIGSFSKSCSPPSTLPNSSYDEFEEVNEAMSIPESFPDAMNKYSFRENGPNLELEELSDTRLLVKPVPVDWMKHLTILVLFGFFTFGQFGKPPSTILQDNEFEIDVLLYQ